MKIHNYTIQVKKKKKKPRIEKRNRDNKKKTCIWVTKSKIWNILEKKLLTSLEEEENKDSQNPWNGWRFASSTRKRGESKQRWRWACGCGLGKKQKLRVAVAVAVVVTAEGWGLEKREGFFYFLVFIGEIVFEIMRCGLIGFFFHIHADWWAGTSLGPLDAFNGWDLCYCTPCNTLGIARDMNP